MDSSKTQLTSQGATDVGVLDSDQFGSLPPGNYVLYSGVYSSKGEAETALKSLSGSFPDAQVIQVAAQASSDTGGGAAKTASNNGGGAKAADDGKDTTLTDGGAANSTKTVHASKEDLQNLDEATGAEYEEIQKKLPPTIATPGKAPPKDNKPAGGGSGGDAVTIG